MAKFAGQGATVYYLVLTDSCKGTADPQMTTEKLKHIREHEQNAALEIIGGKAVEFLGYCDCELEVTQELKGKIVEAIRTIKPDVVVTFDPSMVYSAEHGFINHPDHRAAGQATLDAVFPIARGPLCYPEHLKAGLQPHNTSTILLFNFDKSNFAVDITNTFSKKLAALEAHGSQETMPPEYLEEIAREQGEQYGFELAEAFMRIDIV